MFYQTARAGSYGCTKQKSALIDGNISCLVTVLRIAIAMGTLIEEDTPDGVNLRMNVENRDYTITSCVKDHEQGRERPLTSSISAESQFISLEQPRKQRMN